MDRNLTSKTHFRRRMKDSRSDLDCGLFSLSPSSSFAPGGWPAALKPAGTPPELKPRYAQSSPSESVLWPAVEPRFRTNWTSAMQEAALNTRFRRRIGGGRAPCGTRLFCLSPASSARSFGSSRPHDRIGVRSLLSLAAF